MLLTEVPNFRLAIHLFKVEVMAWDGNIGLKHPEVQVGTNQVG